MLDEEQEEDPGWLEGECQACGSFGVVYDLCLCESCSPRVERDLIRLRDWEYSASAFGLSPEQREALRRQVIKAYGKPLELLVGKGDSGGVQGRIRPRRKRS